jgi:hypothetical protein
MHRNVLLATIAILTLTAACGKESCNVENLVFTSTLNGTGTGTMLDVPVAKFELTQNFLSHTPYAACTTGPLQDVGVVDLTVTNTYSAPLRITYDLQGLTAGGTGGAWALIDTIPRLGPGESISKTKIAVTTTRLDSGARVVITSSQVVP